MVGTIDALHTPSVRLDRALLSFSRETPVGFQYKGFGINPIRCAIIYPYKQ
jgi:hypothetical protein